MPIPPIRKGPPKNLALAGEPVNGEEKVAMVTAWFIKDRIIQCPHCDCIQFDKKQLLMNTKGATLMELDWLNSEASALMCRQCSRIEWFGQEPKQAPVAATALPRPQGAP